MSGNTIQIIQVKFRKLKDWYVATSSELKGLYLAAPSYDVVYNQVPEAIKALYKANSGLDINVEELSTDTEKSTDRIAFIAKAA